MSLAQDIAKFNEKLDAAIAVAMESEKYVFGNVKFAISVSTLENVYPKYEPHGHFMHYERRWGDGGLADPDNNELVKEECGPTGNGYMITVRNNTEGVDGEGPIDQVIEEGYGYTWEYSDIYAKQPFPRPFYGAAERSMIENGTFESALKRGLQDAGFTF